MPFEELHEYCGIFGLFGNPEAANLTYLGLYALQHRGQEAAGIVASDGKILHQHRGMGLVADIFDDEALSALPGGSAIGHVRYSTHGTSVLRNSQPIVAEFARAKRPNVNGNGPDYGAVAVAHNGNLTNAGPLREELEAHGAIFQSTVDSEVILHLLARSTAPSLTTKIAEALRRVEGAYSLLFLTEDSLVGVRDPYGFRPLVLGDLDGKPVLASETCALDLIRARYVREIEPGELVIIDRHGMRSERPFEKAPKRPCVFELVYFARPDSTAFGNNVYESRKAMGAALAKRHPVPADVVCPVPDSGVPAAIGYSHASGIPFELGLIRNHYVGRTFIEPQQSIRNFGVKVKLNAVDPILNGKRVVLIDDSIVRGTTSRKLVRMLRDHGAKEVHMRIAAPPTTHPCFYGIATPTKEELIASKMSVEQIREWLGADSLGYLTVDDMLGSLKVGGKDFCTTCFTGDYVVQPADPAAAGRTGS
ncbi:MAG TPA: amidophosphoribosyltransferase [bacterium]|nr:amidophosphoribosyltransferase [bacterium]